MLTESITRGLERLGYNTHTETELNRILIWGNRGTETVHLEQARSIRGGPLHIKGGWIKEGGIIRESFSRPLLREVLKQAE